MPVLKRIVDLSANGEYLAYSSPDGCLKIWETSTGILKQEYTPSSHLSATCSALSWCPVEQIKHPRKKSKKLKSENDFSSISNLQIIAMGTLTGDVLLYSYVSADLHSHLTNGHTGIVNDLCWCTSTSSLFTCSNDRNIIVWDIFAGKIKMKWKADSVAVHSICIIDSNSLLSASSSIKLWNIEQKTVIKTFTGHATEVFKLLPVNTEEKLENLYFLSAALSDRVINAWQLNEENSKRAIASFVVSDEPESLSIIANKDKPLLLCIVCKDGSLHMFEHLLNGRRKKPLHSKFTVQIASKANDTPSKPHRVPILSASLSLGLDSCLISYGSFLKPSFETIDLSEVSNDIFLIRDLSASSASSQDENVSRIKHADKSEVVKLLAPGHMMPVKDVQSIPRKRKKKDVDDKELSVEEKLRALDLSRIPPNLEEQEPTLKADSMVHLLLQGLQSKDKNLLNTVLQNSDEKIIHSTLKQLPLQSILLLLKELQGRLSKQEQRNHPSINWMIGLLSIHLPYLMSCKDIDVHLGPISQLIEAILQNFPKLCQFQGCLKILLSQTSVNKSEELTLKNSDKAWAVYQSESSEESEADEMDHSVNASDEELPHETSSEESSSTKSDDSEEDMDS